MESEKEKHRRWLIEAIAARPHKSQTELADALGVDKSAVSNIRSGKRAIKSDELYRAAEFLGYPLPTGVGFAETAARFAHAGKQDRDGRLAPLYRATSDGERWLLDRDAPIDARPKLTTFENAARAFAFYAPDDAAAPRFKAREIVWVDPGRLLKPGDDVLFTERSGGKRVFVGEFKNMTETEIVCLNYEDRKERRYSRMRWRALHVLPRH